MQKTVLLSKYVQIKRYSEFRDNLIIASFWSKRTIFTQ